MEYNLRQKLHINYFYSLYWHNMLQLGQVQQIAANLII